VRRKLVDADRVVGRQHAGAMDARDDVGEFDNVVTDALDDRKVAVGREKTLSEPMWARSAYRPVAMGCRTFRPV